MQTTPNVLRKVKVDGVWKFLPVWKQTVRVRQVKVRGLHKVNWVSIFSCAAHNLMRLPMLIAEQRTEGLGQQYA